MKKTTQTATAAIVFAMPVHPAAELFPMLPEDELAELAADIKANGLQHPLVVKDGELIDGRNRREACRRAGVEPRVEELNGAETVAYIISSNIARRHMTVGQRAMMVTRLLETNGGTVSDAAREANVQRTRVSQARLVAAWARELTDGILSGAESLDRAYALAQERKAKAEAPTKRLESLRATDPDIAEKVVEGEMQIDDAEDQARGRRERERVRRQGIYNGLKSLEELNYLFNEAHRRYLAEICRTHPDELTLSTLRAMLTQHRQLVDLTLKELT